MSAEDLEKLKAELPPEENPETETGIDADPVAIVEDDNPVNGFVSVDEFRETFGGGLMIGGTLIQSETLVGSVTVETWPGASQAIYNVCCRVPALNFMVSPGAGWLRDMTIIMAWAGPLIMGIKSELELKKLKKDQAGDLPLDNPANENNPASDLEALAKNED